MQSTLKAFRGAAFVLIGAALCLLPSSATARNTLAERKVAAWNPTPSQIAAMGFVFYKYAYEKHGGDLSTSGMKHSAWHYAECKGGDNDRRLKKLPLALRQRLLSVRRSLQSFDGALHAMLELRAGGGTMYGVLAADSTATGEEALGQIIGASTTKKRDDGARRRALADFAAAQRALAPRLPTPPLDTQGMIGEQQQIMYRDAAKIASTQRTRLQTLGTQLPDVAARLLATRVLEDAGHAFDTLSL
jgi:hypothetical protein